MRVYIIRDDEAEARIVEAEDYPAAIEVWKRWIMEGQEDDGPFYPRSVELISDEPVLRAGGDDGKTSDSGGGGEPHGADDGVQRGGS